MTLDLKDDFLASLMQTPEYIKISQKYISPDIINKYNLQSKFHYGYIYCEINKDMFGLKQAALLANNFLVKKLRPYVYHPIPHTIGIWKHKSHSIIFYLFVDDVGLKYFHKQDINYLINALQQHYKLSID